MIQLLKEASDTCPVYLIVMDSVHQVDQFTKRFQDGLKQGSGQYVLILENDTLDTVRSMFQDDTSFFSKIVNLAVVVGSKLNPVKKVVLARDPLNESKTIILNHWNGTGFEDPNVAMFPRNRLSNLNRKKLTVTSFDYAPFHYVGSDGNRYGVEVRLQYYLAKIKTHLKAAFHFSIKH